MSKEIKKIKTTPITANESRERASFKMFKFLFPLPKENVSGDLSFEHLSKIEMEYKKLTFNAKLLYILLKNKYLMITNNGKSVSNDVGVYADESGDIYVEYTTKDFLKLSGIKDPKTIRNAKSQLKNAELLEEVVTTGKHANRFYLLRPQIKSRSLKYNINDSEGLETYYELPQYLFTHDEFKNMPLSAKFAYAILRERYLYSVKKKSESFIDDKGSIYCIYTNTKLATAIGYEYSKPIPKIKKDLITHRLLTEEKITGEASRIYVNTPTNLYDIETESASNPTESKKKTRGETSLWVGGNYHSGRGELSLTIDTLYLHSFYQHVLLNYHNPEKQETKKDNSKPSGSSLNQNNTNNKLLNLVKSELNIKLTKQYKNSLIDLFNKLDTKVIDYAIEYTSLKATSPKQYLVSILENWIKAGIKTVEQAKAYKATTKTHKANESKEMTPQWLIDRNKSTSDNTSSKSKNDDENLEADREAFLQQLQQRWTE